MPTLKVPKDSPLHRSLVAKVRDRIRLGEKSNIDLESDWQAAEERTLAFLPESEVDAARRNKREVDGEPSFTTIQIPYTYALLLSAHTYWTSVFFSRSPIHQFAGRHGEGEMQVQAMEALIDYQVQVGGIMVPYYIWLYDCGKYGRGILGHYWEKEKLHYGQLVDMEDPNNPGKTSLMQATAEMVGYEGNRAFNAAPFDFLHDPRVAFKNFQQGEFCAVRCRLGWNQILRRKDAGYFNENIQFLKGHNYSKGDNLGSSTLRRPQFNQTMYETEDKTHPSGVVFWEFYVELVPSEWGLGETKFPQKWCITITEDLELIVGATPLGLLHCKFPFDVIESEIEGYGLATRGLPKIAEPIQQTMDWLINSHFFNVRASLNNQFIVDPSKLVIKDFEDTGPGFRWRLRPEAYGTDLTKIFHQVPVQDVTRSHMGDFQGLLGMGERMFGVNDQIMGALNGQGRKTATEVRTTTTFGINRQKTICEYMSSMGFAPHAQKLVQTSQQMYSAEAKLRRVGSFAQEAGAQFISVSPQDITGFYDLVPVDGTLPVDRMAQGNLWKEIFANVARMPMQVQTGYDWGRIFAWTASLIGLRNINQFRVQVMPDQQLAQQAQAGNVVPMPSQPRLPKPAGVQAGQSASTAAGLNALGGQGGPQGAY